MANVTSSISRNAFAKKVGVTAAAVRQRIANGRLAGAVLADGSLDEAEATRLWEENSAHHMKRGEARRLKTKDREDGHRIKLRQMSVDLEAAEIRLARLKDTTIDRGQAIEAGRAAMRALRDHMLNFANRYGASIAGELGTDPGETMGLIEAKVRLALAEVAGAENPFAAELGSDEVAHV